MKKIVALGAAAALIGGLFAAEPASNPSLVSFTGNASVEWGVDLDAGKTGFKNGTWTQFKIKLFDAGDKALTGDGVWAELVMKVDDSDSVGPIGYFDNNGDAAYKAQKAYIDVAKLHFNNIYVGIKSGDTQVGETDFTTAIKSADPWFHPGRWLDAVGPRAIKKYDDEGKPVYTHWSQGIVAGYADDNMDLGVDFRSLDWGQYTNSYAVAGEFKIKDTNSFAEGLSVGLGAAYNLNDFYFTDSSTGTAVAENEGYEFDLPKDVKDGLNNYGFGAFNYDHMLGYAASVGYKLKLDDKLWLKPQVGFEGELATYKDTGDKYEYNYAANTNVVVGGVMFGWGDTNSYGSTGGLYFFDDDGGDKAKGLTPGFSAIVKVPLPYTLTVKGTSHGTSGSLKLTYHDALKALIIPSLYSGDIVENLSFAAYSEIGLFEYKDPADTVKTSNSGNDYAAEAWGVTADGKNTFALALAAGVKYDIKADDITVTPKASIRYANTCYVENHDAIKAAIPNNKDMFDGFGIQEENKDGERKDLYAADFFNLEAGVDVAGLINNTTFFGHYKSANLLNKRDYKSEKIDNVANPNYAEYGMYNVKLGTFNVGCKISF